MFDKSSNKEVLIYRIVSLITAICPVCVNTVAETPASEPPITPVAAAFNSESTESKPRMTAMMPIAVLLSLDLL